MGEHGTPYGIFSRAIKDGNLVMADAVARELSDVGRFGLGSALELTALIALKDRRRASRAGARWLGLYLSASRSANLHDVSIVIGCLNALGGDEHEHALATLQAISARAGKKAA